jgi:hypothetical protein
MRRIIESGQDWSDEDWQVFFDERADIAEFDGELPRADAEAQAFACSVVEWMDRNQERSVPGCCLDCGRGDRPDDPLLPFGTEPGSHAWLHGACWPTWDARRKAKATDALRATGIRA